MMKFKDGRKEKGVKEYIDRAVIRARSLESQDNADNGNNRSTPNRGRNDSVDSNISRKGRYYDRPSLYVKTQRADRFGVTEYSKPWANTSFQSKVYEEYMKLVDSMDDFVAVKCYDECGICSIEEIHKLIYKEVLDEKI